jgi:hypothetical protein
MKTHPPALIAIFLCTWSPRNDKRVKPLLAQILCAWLLVSFLTLQYLPGGLGNGFEDFTIDKLRQMPGCKNTYKISTLSDGTKYAEKTGQTCKAMQFKLRQQVCPNTLICKKDGVPIDCKKGGVPIDFDEKIPCWMATIIDNCHETSKDVLEFSVRHFNLWPYIESRAEMYKCDPAKEHCKSSKDYISAIWHDQWKFRLVCCFSTLMVHNVWPFIQTYRWCVYMVVFLCALSTYMCVREQEKLSLDDVTANLLLVLRVVLAQIVSWLQTIASFMQEVLLSCKLDLPFLEVTKRQVFEKTVDWMFCIFFYLLVLLSNRTQAHGLVFFIAKILNLAEFMKKLPTVVPQEHERFHFQHKSILTHIVDNADYGVQPIPWSYWLLLQAHWPFVFGLIFVLWKRGWYCECGIFALLIGAIKVFSLHLHAWTAWVPQVFGWLFGQTSLLATAETLIIWVLLCCYVVFMVWRLMLDNMIQTRLQILHVERESMQVRYSRYWFQEPPPPVRRRKRGDLLALQNA